MDRSSVPADNKRLRVLVADADDRVRSALRFLLGWTDETEVIAEAGGIELLLRESALHRPDVILLDWRIARSYSGEVIPELRLAHPGVLVVALGLTHEERAVALTAGADAFACKLDGPSALLSVIRTLARPALGSPPSG